MTQIDPKSWLDSYGDGLYSYALYRGGDKALAEELVAGLSGSFTRETVGRICDELGKNAHVWTGTNYWVLMHRARLAIRTCLE